jgi:hypothetical protein
MILSAGTRRLSLILSFAIAGSAGCGKGGPQRATVAGSVQLDGQPVESGSIAFYPVEGTRGPSAGGRIEAGRYRIASAKGAVVGKARVEINAPKKTGRMIPDPINSKALVEEYVEGIPSKYNSESTLTRDIAAGDNQLDFNLTTK